MGYNTAMLRRRAWTAEQEAREWKWRAKKKDHIERAVFPALESLTALAKPEDPVTMTFTRERAEARSDLAYGFAVDPRGYPEQHLRLMLKGVNELLDAALLAKMFPEGLELVTNYDYEASKRYRVDRFTLRLSSWRKIP